MMSKRVRINFVERSKEVQADVTVEYEGPTESIINDKILEESYSLFIAAQRKANLLSMGKEMKLPK